MEKNTSGNRYFLVYFSIIIFIELAIFTLREIYPDNLIIDVIFKVMVLGILIATFIAVSKLGVGGPKK